jgi:acyl dehydratase
MDTLRDTVVEDRATLVRVFSDEDVAEWAALAGARDLPRGVVPGPLVASMISCLLGTRLPGRGTNWLKQKLAFARAARVGEAITCVVEVTRVRPEKGLANLRTTCTGAMGGLICDGEALVLMKEME